MICGLIILLVGFMSIGATIVINGPRIPAAGGGGPDVWYYAGSGKGDTSYTTLGEGWEPHLNAYGGSISVASGGTCTSISAKVRADTGTIAWKIALYDSDNNLLASGTFNSTTTAQWYDVTINQSVSSGTYKVMYSCSTSLGNIYRDSDQSGLEDAVTYSAFPESTLSASTSTNNLYGVRMYVD